MALLQTTVLPSDDAALSCAMFRELIHEQPCILFVVNGVGPEAEATVQRADRIAYNQGDQGWRVVWARMPDAIAKEVGALKAEPPALAAQVSGCRAFVTSLADVVMDVVKGADTAPDNTRIMQAFLRGEAGL